MGVLRLPAIAALLALALQAQAPSEKDINAAVAEVAEITGFKLKRPIPSATMSKQEWKRWLEDELARHAKPEEIRAQEVALKMFGLVPQDFDLRSATIDLYTEQAAAFYDSRRKRMTFVEGYLDEMVSLTLPHELAHALADQHYNLEKFLDKAAKNDDAQLARLAVAEGQATWVMFEATVRKLGQSFFKMPSLLDQYAKAMNDSGGMNAPVFQNSPLYIRRTLIFPYTQGLLFQHHLIERSGKAAFDQVLRKPPETTHELIHPDVYLEGFKPSVPALPEWPESKAYKHLIDGTLGEIDVQLLLEQFVSAQEATALAPHWRGGAFTVFAHKKDNTNVLAWAVDWATPEAAQRFVEHYRTVLDKKAPPATYATTTAEQLQGVSAAGAFLIRASGLRTEGLEGLPSKRP